MKKRLTLVFALSLMLCALAMPASAEAADAHVYLDAPAQAETGDTVGVALYVSGDTVGGVQGTITYNADELEYVGVTLRDDVKALGNTDDVTYHADGSGVIEFVTVSNVAGGAKPADAWLTVNFTVKLANAGDTAAVTLSNVVVSDPTGTVRLNATTADTTVQVMVKGTNDYIDLDGATIRTSVQSQGIRFQAQPADFIQDMSKVTEVGVVMFPTALLYEGQDLTKETIGKGGTKPAIARVTEADADKMLLVRAGEELYATLTNGTTGGRANVAITARAYAVVDGVTVYSYNDNGETNVSQGAASKTLVGVAQAIAAKEIAGGATDTLGELLTKQTRLTDDEVITLLTFCRNNIDKLPKA